MKTEVDVLIVGAGSAGLSAALMLARSRRRVLLLDGGAPRNAVAAHMHGVLGRDGWSPLELLATGCEEVQRYGAVIENSLAKAIEPGDDGFEVMLSSGAAVGARRVLVSTGLRDELPGIPGLAEQWGIGVAHCPYCDGWEVRDKRISVIATSSTSTHLAQLLRQLSPSVTYFTAGTELDNDGRRGLTARGIGVDDRPISRVVIESGRITGVQLDDGENLDTDVVFVRPRTLPHDDLLVQLDAESSEGPEGRWVTVDAFGRTSVPGVWAAGNVVNPTATVPVAAAAGATAGASINADLVEEDTRLAIAADSQASEKPERTFP